MRKYFIRIIGLLILINLSSTCCISQKVDLVNTRWVYKYDNCQDYLEFKKDKKYLSFSCETNKTVYGSYYFDDGFLILEQKKGEFDDDFPENSRHKTEHLKFKLQLKNGKLKYIERWELDKNNKWVKSNFKFDDDYLLEKIKK